MIDEIGNKYAASLGASEAVLDMLSSRDDSILTVAALCKGGTILGFSEQNIRVALTRLVKQGKVAKLARGRYGLNPDGNDLLTDVKGWFEKSKRIISWTGNWIAVSDSTVARSQRTQWRHHERALNLRGFRRMRCGMLLRPDNLRGGVAQARTELHGLGLSEQASVFSVHGLSEADTTEALGLWDVEALICRYQGMLDKLENSEAELSTKSDENAAAETLLVGREVIRCIIQDPLLPQEIINSDLLGVLVKRTRAYQIQAQRYWTRVTEPADLSSEIDMTPTTE